MCVRGDEQNLPFILKCLDIQLSFKVTIYL